LTSWKEKRVCYFNIEYFDIIMIPLVWVLNFFIKIIQLIGQKLYTHWVWDEDEFLLWRWDEYEIMIRVPVPRHVVIPNHDLIPIPIPIIKIHPDPIPIIKFQSHPHPQIQRVYNFWLIHIPIRWWIYSYTPIPIFVQFQISIK